MVNTSNTSEFSQPPEKIELSAEALSTDNTSQENENLWSLMNGVPMLVVTTASSEALTYQRMTADELARLRVVQQQWGFTASKHAEHMEESEENGQ